ncbi:hypothetical protein M8J76_017137 [Diaphorina citri]|nr:hypothetical protein M8J76_017137 [Diaphorina citri]
MRRVKENLRFADSLLTPMNQPVPANNLSFPVNFNNNHADVSKNAANVNNQLGSTWTNAGSLNINLDNLTLSNPNATSPTNAPSMNQLANKTPLTPTGAMFRPAQHIAPAGPFSSAGVNPSFPAVFPPTPVASPGFFPAGTGPAGPAGSGAPFYQYQNFQTSLK